MGLLFMDGFELYNDAGINLNNALTRRGWFTSGVSGGGLDQAIFQDSSVSNPTATGAATAQSVRFDDASGTFMQRLITIPDGDTFIVGFNFQATNVATDQDIFEVLSPSGTCVSINYTSTGYKVILDNGATGPIVGTISANSWQYIELKIVNGVTTGSYELRIDGTVVDSATSVDTTANGSSNSYTNFFLRGSSGRNVRFDDFYIADNTDFLGPLNIQTYLPESDGTTNDMTPLSGSVNAEMVDDPVYHDSDTTYVEASSIGDRELYNFADKSDTGAIKGIQMTTFAKDSGLGVSNLRHVIKDGASEDVGPSTALGSNYLNPITDLHETNPITSAPWTDGDFDNYEFGFEST